LILNTHEEDNNNLRSKEKQEVDVEQIEMDMIVSRNDEQSPSNNLSNQYDNSLKHAVSASIS